jgi:3-oxoacyl-[acyl-carrier-protein] synthase-3
MLRSMVLGTGHYVPSRVVTNEDLAQRMDTSDEWIVQRTGIVSRRHVDFDKEPMGASDLGTKAAAQALEAAGLTPQDVDLIVYATLSPDKAFPGDGVLVQAKLGVPSGVPALDIRNQCSGFLYGLSIADAFIRLGTYRCVLVIGSEVHSTGLDFTDRGRDVAVIFGDGAGAAVLGPTQDPHKGILSVHLHADGRFAEELECPYPSSAHMPRITAEDIEKGIHYPKMNGKNVFKHASTRMPEVVLAALEKQGYTPADIHLLIPHQANLRISEMVQKKLGLSEEQVFNNIQRYGNTTAASIPIALNESIRLGKIKEGDLVCLAAFGAGFTWGSALIRW